MVNKNIMYQIVSLNIHCSCDSLLSIEQSTIKCCDMQAFLT